MVKRYFALVLVVLISLVSVAPLFHSGLPPTHDGEYHVIRFNEFFETLRSGDLYPRWAGGLNMGFGIPLFNFVYPLSNYIAALFHLFGVSFIDSFKINLILGTLVGSISFYFFIKYFTDSFSGLVGATLYTFTPYRFVDIYVRGSVGEVWAIAFLPAFLWSLSIVILEKKQAYIIPSSLFFALLIFSHNILALLFVPFLLSFTIILLLSKRSKIASFYTVVVYLLGLGISSIFWLPALFEKNSVRGLEIYDLTGHFSDFASLLFPSWGTGFSGGGATTTMSTQIGLVNLLVVTLSFVLFFKIKRKITLKWLFFFSLFWFFLGVFLMMEHSSIIWTTIPLFSYVQFPWRYLSLVIFLCSLLGSFVVYVTKWKKVAGIILMALAIISTISYTKPAYYHERTDSHYFTRANFTDGTNSPGNAFNTLWFTVASKRAEKKLQLQEGDADIVQKSVLPTKYFFSTTVRKNTTFIINTAYFPGWKVLVNGKEQTIQRTSEGRMLFALFPGTYTIEIVFTDTIIRRVATLIFILSLLSCFMLVLRSKKVLNSNESSH